MGPNRKLYSYPIINWGEGGGVARIAFYYSTFTLLYSYSTKPKGTKLYAGEGEGRGEGEEGKEGERNPRRIDNVTCARRQRVGKVRAGEGEGEEGGGRRGRRGRRGREVAR